MSKIDEAIAETAYILDVLMAYRHIANSGDCNICAIRRECDYVPKPGELVRYNCPHYEAVEEVK